MNQNVLIAHVYVLGHVGVRKIAGEIPSHSWGGGAWGLQQSTFMYSTPVTPAYVHTLRTLLSKQEQIKEITMEALRWRKSDRRASRGLALVRGRCVSDKEEFLELAGDLIPFPVSGGKRRGTK